MWKPVVLLVALGLACVAAAQSGRPADPNVKTPEPRPAPDSAWGRAAPQPAPQSAPDDPLVKTPSGAVMPRSWAVKAGVPYVLVGEHAWWDAR